MPDSQLSRIGFADAVQCRADLESLKTHWPAADWSVSMPEDTNLFASKRKTAIIIGLTFAAVVAVLFALYPVPAAVVGLLGLMVFAKIWLGGIGRSATPLE